MAAGVHRGFISPPIEHVPNTDIELQWLEEFEVVFAGTFSGKRRNLANILSSLSSDSLIELRRLDNVVQAQVSSHEDFAFVVHHFLAAKWLDRF